jgi:hypothetical protein
VWISSAAAIPARVPYSERYEKIVKDASPAEIVGAVRQSAAGECVMPPEAVGEVLDRLREREIPVTARSEQAAAGIRAVLSDRELEVFERLAGGGTNREIGLELSLSEHTVKNHLASFGGDEFAILMPETTHRRPERGDCPAGV